MLRLRELEGLLGVRKTFIYTSMKAGTFPNCIRLSSRVVLWRESDIAEWQASKQAKQSGV